jgi:hypothetical protein
MATTLSKVLRFLVDADLLELEVVARAINNRVSVLEMRADEPAIYIQHVPSTPEAVHELAQRVRDNIAKLFVQSPDLEVTYIHPQPSGTMSVKKETDKREVPVSACCCRAGVISYPVPCPWHGGAMPWDNGGEDIEVLQDRQSLLMLGKIPCYIPDCQFDPHHGHEAHDLDVPEEEPPTPVDMGPWFHRQDGSGCQVAEGKRRVRGKTTCNDHNLPIFQNTPQKPK